MKALLLMLVFCGVAAGQIAEPPLPSDSLQSDSIIFFADSTDTLQASGGVVDAVLIPIALIVATAGIFILLFTTRSK